MRHYTKGVLSRSQREEHIPDKEFTLFMFPQRCLAASLQAS